MVNSPSNDNGNGHTPDPRTWMRFILDADASWTDLLERPSPPTEHAPPSPSRGEESNPTADHAHITLYVFDDPASAAGASYHATIRRHPDMTQEDALRRGATRATLSVTDEDGTIRRRLRGATPMTGRLETTEGPLTFQAHLRAATSSAPNELALDLWLDKTWTERDANVLELLGTLRTILLIADTS